MGSSVKPQSSVLCPECWSCIYSQMKTSFLLNTCYSTTMLDARVELGSDGVSGVRGRVIPRMLGFIIAGHLWTPCSAIGQHETN